MHLSRFTIFFLACIPGLGGVGLTTQSKFGKGYACRSCSFAGNCFSPSPFQMCAFLLLFDTSHCPMRHFHSPSLKVTGETYVLGWILNLHSCIAGLSTSTPSTCPMVVRCLWVCPHLHPLSILWLHFFNIYFECAVDKHLLCHQPSTQETAMTNHNLPVSPIGLTKSISGTPPLAGEYGPGEFHVGDTIGLLCEFVAAHLTITFFVNGRCLGVLFLSPWVELFECLPFTAVPHNTVRDMRCSELHCYLNHPLTHWDSAILIPVCCGVCGNALVGDSFSSRTCFSSWQSLPNGAVPGDHVQEGGLQRIDQKGQHRASRPSSRT